MLEQVARSACVFRKNYIYFFQNTKPTKGNVFKISNRSGDDKKFHVISVRTELKIQVIHVFVFLAHFQKLIIPIFILPNDVNGMAVHANGIQYIKYIHKTFAG